MPPAPMSARISYGPSRSPDRRDMIVIDCTWISAPGYRSAAVRRAWRWRKPGCRCAGRSSRRARGWTSESPAVASELPRWPIAESPGPQPGPARPAGALYCPFRSRLSARRAPRHFRPGTGWSSQRPCRFNCSIGSFLQPRGPVQHDDDGRRNRVAALGVDQEPLAVAAGDVVRVECIHSVRTRLEKRLGDPEQGTGVNRNGHEFPVLGKVVDLTPVSPPTGFVSAAGGDGPFPVGEREGSNLDLIPAGVVRGVGDEAAVGREVSLYLVGRSAREPDRLPAVERQQPEVAEG